MTRGTVVHDTGVIKHRIQKATCYVTHTTILGRWYMTHRFAQSCSAIVTRGTVVHDAGVIKHGGGKRGGVVAVGAIFCRGHMGR